MDLISREAAIEALGEEPMRWNNTITEGQEWNDWKYHVNAIKIVPSIPAVPLDELCLLLHDIAGSPCYTQPGEDMCHQLIGDQCNPEWDDAECWKQFLTKWMEAQGNG